MGHIVMICPACYHLPKEGLPDIDSEHVQVWEQTEQMQDQQQHLRVVARRLAVWPGYSQQLETKQVRFKMLMNSLAPSFCCVCMHGCMASCASCVAVLAHNLHPIVTWGMLLITIIKW